jgi:lipid-binding SYLF domain-containing protein
LHGLSGASHSVSLGPLGENAQLFTLSLRT